MGHESFIGEDEEEGEFFEDGDLGDAGAVEDPVPTAGVVGRGDVDAVVGADGKHRVVVWLVEGGGAVDVCSADRGGFCIVDELGFDFSDGAIEGRALDGDGSGGRGQCLVGESGICNDSQFEWFGVLREEGGSMSGLGFDDLVAPFLSALRAWGVEGVCFRSSEMLDPEGIHCLFVLGTVKDSCADECLSRCCSADRGSRGGGVGVCQRTRSSSS